MGFELAEFAVNPTPRVACVLLLDSSASMKDNGIEELNQGVKQLIDALKQDPIARRSVEIAVVAFDSQITPLTNFSTADNCDPPYLTAKGLTKMGEAVNVALGLIRRRLTDYQNAQISKASVPWVFMITDGGPTDDPERIWRDAAQEVRELTSANRLMFVPIGVANANMEILKQFADNPVYLNGLNFSALFKWISMSLKTASNSRGAVIDMERLPPAAGNYYN